MGKVAWRRQCGSKSKSGMVQYFLACSYQGTPPFFNGWKTWNPLFKCRAAQYSCTGTGRQTYLCLSNPLLGLLLHYCGARKGFPFISGKAAVVPIGLLGSESPVEVAQNQADASSQKLLCTPWEMGLWSSRIPAPRTVLPLHWKALSLLPVLSLPSSDLFVSQAQPAQSFFFQAATEAGFSFHGLVHLSLPV